MEIKGRGRPKKITQPTEESPVNDKEEEIKAKRLEFKADHLEEIRIKQSQRYQKVKDELQLKRLMSNVFSEKYTDEQRAKLAEKLAQHAQHRAS